MDEKMTIGNVKDSRDIELELDYIANFEVEIKLFNNSKRVILTTTNLLFKSDFEKLKKYFDKYDYEFNAVDVFRDCLVLYYEPIKEMV